MDWSSNTERFGSCLRHPTQHESSAEDSFERCRSGRVVVWNDATSLRDDLDPDWFLDEGIESDKHVAARGSTLVVTRSCPAGIAVFPGVNRLTADLANFGTNPLVLTDHGGLFAEAYLNAGGVLYVSDRSNNRVVLYDTLTPIHRWPGRSSLGWETSRTCRGIRAGRLQRRKAALPARSKDRV